jgi:SAM-dependent methyltransferase
MQINAASHLIRAARQLGILDRLRGGQLTLPQLCEALALPTTPADLLLDGLVAIGVIEKYREDFALSQAAHLLCQYDEDLGDDRWQRLVDCVRGQRDRAQHDDQQQLDDLAATQWIHTPAAIEAAEMLDVGRDDGPQGLQILDLGCGSAVWSCAMAHRDPYAVVTAVDNAAALEAAIRTADSIGLRERFHAVQADDLRAAVIPEQAFDLVLVAQRVACLDWQAAAALVERASRCVKPGGRLVVIDLFRGPARPLLAETVESLKLHLDTRGGAMRSLDEAKDLLCRLGLEQVQFAYLPASKVNMGLAVATAPGVAVW